MVPPFFMSNKNGTSEQFPYRFISRTTKGFCPTLLSYNFKQKKSRNGGGERYGNILDTTEVYHVFDDLDTQILKLNI